MQVLKIPSEASNPPVRNLMGKTAIVTGSTSGIGLGIARSLAEAGANIMFNGFGSSPDFDVTREAFEKNFGVRTTFSGADMSAAFHTIRSVIPEMKARGWGRIINIASAHGLVASPFKSAYVAAKHGIVGLTKAVALEVAEHGITVNAICPGYVLTPLVEKQIPETAHARMLTEEQVIHDVILHAQPTHKFVTTEEVGALTVFLCQDAAKSITGAALPIEGGWTAQ